MPTLRWTGEGTFSDAKNNFVAYPREEYDFDDQERVESYLDHASGKWERAKTPAPDDMDEDESDGKDEFTTINGVGPSTAESLLDEGFESLNDLRDTTLEELAEADGVTQSKAERIHEQLAKDEE